MKLSIQKLKFLGLIIAFIGLMIGLFDLTGSFSHPNRELIVQLILQKGLVPHGTLGFEEFLTKFPPPDGWTRSEITGISPLSMISSGGVVTPTGPLIYVGHGKRTTEITTVQAAVEWSQESSYPWASWVITTVGWVVCACGIFLEQRGSAITQKTGRRWH